MRTPGKYYAYAYWYLFVCFAGIGSTTLYNLTAATLRAVGDTVAPLVIRGVCSAMNSGLNFLFILAFRMNYTGVALATVGSQFFSGFGGLVYMIKRYPVLRPAAGDWRAAVRLWRGHIAIGLPMALQFSVTAVGCIFQQSALNALDDSLPGVVTAYAAASKISNLFDGIFSALGTTMATYAGQNYGAREYGRIKDGVFTGLVYTLVLWAFGFAFCFFLTGAVTGLFLDKSSGDAALYYAEMIAYSKKYMFCQSVFFGPLLLIHVYRNVLQGMDRSVLTMAAGVMELFGRALSSFLFVKLFSFTGICLSNPTAWVAADLFLVVCYYAIIRKYPSECRYSLSRLFRSRKSRKAAQP